MIRLYILNGEKYLKKGVSDLWDTFPFGDAERARLDGIRSCKKRAESLSALLALHRLLIKADVAPMSIARSEKGKPFFIGDNAPHFSISHSDLISVAALCDAEFGPIGIDAEVVDAKRASKRVAERFFDKNEQREFSESDDKAGSFFEIWTKKEAIAKFYGIGVFDTPDNDGGTVSLSSFCVEVGGREVMISVCCRNKDPQIQIFRDHEE